MAVQASDVAAVIRERDPSIGTTKLHKLLYYCQGIHLAHTGKPLFDDTISAWDRGPVVGSLWKADAEGQTAILHVELDNTALGTVNYVFSTYGGLSGGELSRLTHQEAPWIRGDEERRQRGEASAKIRVEWIADYFRSTSKDADEDGDALDMNEVHKWLAEVASTPTPAAGVPATRESLAAWARRGA